MQQQIVNSELFLSLSSEFQTLVVQLLALKEKGTLESGIINLTFAKEITFASFTPHSPLSILGINENDLKNVLREAMSDEILRQNLGLDIADNIVNQNHTALDKEGANLSLQFTSLSKILSQYKTLESSLKGIIDKTNRKIASFNIIELKMPEIQNDRSELQNILETEIRKFEIAVATAKQNLHLHCSSTPYTEAYIHSLSELSTPSLETLIIFAKLKEIDYKIHRNHDMNSIVLIWPTLEKHQYFYFEPNKFSLLIETRGYNLHKIWEILDIQDPTLLLSELTKCKPHSYPQHQTNTSPYQTGINDLPDDTINTILQYLLPSNHTTEPKGYKDILRFGRTTKRFNGLSKKDSLWVSQFGKMQTEISGHFYKNTKDLYNPPAKSKITPYIYFKNDITTHRSSKNLTLIINYYENLIKQGHSNSFLHIETAKLLYSNFLSYKKTKRKVSINPYINCLRHAFSAIELGNLAGWLVVYCTLNLKKEPDDSKLVSTTVSEYIFKKSGETIDTKSLPEHVLQVFLLYFCKPNLGNTQFDVEFTQTVVDNYLQLDKATNTSFSIELLTTNFQKKRKAFLALSLQFGKILICLETLQRLSQYDNYTNIFKYFSLDEINALARNYQIGHNIIHFLCTPNSYNEDQLDTLVKHYRNILDDSCLYFTGAIFSSSNQSNVPAMGTNRVSQQLYKVPLSILNNIILSPNCDIILSKFTGDEINELFNPGNNRLDINKPTQMLSTNQQIGSDENQNKELTIALLSENIQHVLAKYNATELLSMLTYSIYETNSSISDLTKFHTCNLSITQHVIETLMKCNLLSRARVTDIIYLLLNPVCLHAMREDEDMLKQVSYMDIQVLTAVYKNEILTKLFRSNPTLFSHLSPRLMNFVETNIQFINSSTLIIINDLRLNFPAGGLVLERLAQIINKPRCLQFFSENARASLLLLDLSPNDFNILENNLISMFSKLSRDDQNIISSSTNFLSLIFNYEICNFIALDILCKKPLLLSVMKACRTANIKMTNWKQTDIEKLFSTQRPLNKAEFETLEDCPHLFTMTTGLSQLKELLKSPMLERLTDTKNHEILGKIGFKKLKEAQEIIVNFPYLIDKKIIDGIQRRTVILSEIILSSGGEKLWRLIYRQTEGSLKKIKILLEEDSFVQLLLAQDDDFLDTFFSNTSLEEARYLSRTAFPLTNDTTISFLCKLSNEHLNILLNFYSTRQLLQFTEVDAIVFKCLTYIPSLAQISTSEKPSDLNIKEKIKLDLENFGKLLLHEYGFSTLGRVFLQSEFVLSLFSFIDDAKLSLPNPLSSVLGELLAHPLLPLLLTIEKCPCPVNLGNLSLKTSQSNLAKTSPTLLDFEKVLVHLDYLHKIEHSMDQSLLQWLAKCQDRNIFEFILSLNQSFLEDKKLISILTSCESNHPLFSVFTGAELLSLYFDTIESSGESLLEILMLPGTKKEFSALISGNNKVTSEPEKGNKFMNYIQSNKASVCQLMIFASRNSTKDELVTTTSNFISRSKRKKINFIAEVTNESIKKMKESHQEDIEMDDANNFNSNPQ